MQKKKTHVYKEKGEIDLMLYHDKDKDKPPVYDGDGNPWWARDLPRYVAAEEDVLGLIGLVRQTPNVMDKKCSALR